ncbi:MAG: NAD(P)H-hydrate epimerase [Candidatus Omnitrophica bacterium]|nr:NAD(P)H-hydrate epimerase [Candidatus Omnitrophota bacterium]
MTGRLLSSNQAKRVDSKAERSLGLPVLLLMENAGSRLAQEAIKSLKGRFSRVAVFCGKGNNGGDGLVCARHLLASGFKPDIYLAAKKKEIGREAGINLEVLIKLKAKVTEVKAKNLARVRKKIAGSGLIIDALLGVGLKGEPRGLYPDLIGLINACGARVLSVDIPSGLDATTGKIPGSCVKADLTVTFVAKKRGMALADGPRVCGKIVVRDLGVPL